MLWQIINAQSFGGINAISNSSSLGVLNNTTLSVLNNTPTINTIPQSIFCTAPSAATDIASIQKILIKYNYLPQGNDTGILGPKTKQATIAFQRANNIKQTGTIGPITLSKLQESCK